MDREIIVQKLYERYIEPTKRTAKDYIGVEIEMPIVNLNKEAVPWFIS